MYVANLFTLQQLMQFTVQDVTYASEQLFLLDMTNCMRISENTKWVAEVKLARPIILYIYPGVREKRNKINTNEFELGNLSQNTYMNKHIAKSTIVPQHTYPVCTKYCLYRLYLECGDIVSLTLWHLHLLYPDKSRSNKHSLSNLFIQSLLCCRMAYKAFMHVCFANLVT